MIYSQDVGMEFGIGKCAMLIMKNEKRKIIQGIGLPNQERIRALREKGKLQKRGNIGSGHHQTRRYER